MHSQVPILGPIVPVGGPPPPEPSMLPVVQDGDPRLTPSGLLDVRTLASLQAPDADVRPQAGPTVAPGLDLPRFSGNALLDTKVALPGNELAEVLEPREPVAAEAPKRRVVWGVAAVASLSVVVGLILVM